MSCARAQSAARRTVRITCLLLGLSAWSVAAAQESVPPTPPPAVAPLEYESEVSQALSEHERGNFEASRRHFLRAHEVFPNARTLRGLGKVEFELHNYPQAVQYLQSALSAPVRPLPAELRDEVQKLLDRARAHEAERARVATDSSSTVAAGPRVELTERENASPMQEDRPPTATPAYRKWWVWTISGVAAAGVVTAVLLATRDPETRTRPVPPNSTVIENP